MNIYAPRRGSPEADAAARRQAIVEVVQAVAIRSQQELADHLHRRGFQATQATLSRDLRNLGIGKVPGSEGGARYVLPKTPHEVMDESQRRLEVGAFIQSVELIGNLALVRTPPGNAHGVGRALDSLGWPEIAGTIAGDDTLLVVTRTATAARSFRRKLSDITRRAYR